MKRDVRRVARFQLPKEAELCAWLAWRKRRLSVVVGGMRLRESEVHACVAVGESEIEGMAQGSLMADEHPNAMEHGHLEPVPQSDAAPQGGREPWVQLGPAFRKCGPTAAAVHPDRDGDADAA